MSGNSTSPTGSEDPDEDVPMTEISVNNGKSNTMDDSDSDSDSDDDIPITALNVAVTPGSSSNSTTSNKQTAQAMDEDDDSDDSDSDDDIPLMAIRRPNISKGVKSGVTSGGTSKVRTKRGQKRVWDSEDDDNDDSGDSSDDEVIVAPASRTRAQKPRKTPPPKRRKLANGTAQRVKKNSSPSKSSSKSSSKSGSKSKLGYINREVHDPDKYPQKKDVVPLKSDKNAIKWWDRLDDIWNENIKWNTLDHNGVVFAPPYEPHGVPMKYEGETIHLTPEQEELATMYGVMIETDWITKDKFKANFMKQFRRILNDPKQGKTHRHIKDLDKCDFRDIYNWYQEKKEKEKLMKKQAEYKAKLKAAKEEMDEKYGWAIVDGIREKVQNYKVEPPGLFRGRGEHPKMGQLKKRLQPEDVILNIGKGMAIPKCPVDGHKWGGVIHDQSVTYIAKWIENINGQHKFVYLHASSRFKGEADVKKYEKARKLKKYVGKIRADYGAKLKSKERHLKQLATAVWIIDHLSIRVGNEKDTDEEADTVGVCSLRREHIKFHEEKSEITLDFLGKDSMRYLQTIKIPKDIFKNLASFCKGKKPDQNIFEKIDTGDVNTYLREQMEGLSAKVFRTHNASVCLQDELRKKHHPSVGHISRDSALEDKVFFYNQCNKQVAILCNHQRSVSKSHDQQMEKMDQQLEDFKDAIKALQHELEVAQGKRSPPKPVNGKSKRIRGVEQLQRMIERKKKQLRKKELDKEIKKENKEIALGTSKINYMDPRITVAWCKEMEVPIEKVFNKSLLDKFPWAMSTPPDFDF